VAENIPFVWILYYKSCIHGHKLRLYRHKSTQKRKVFLKNREKMMKINRKRSQINHLHFSRGREKAMKISHPLRFTKNAGQTKKRELNALFSIVSLTH